MIGEVVSHYKITGELGRGGMGVVYKADDLTLKRTVALKFLSPHLLTNPDQKARFLHEAQAVAALEHPNISTVYEIHESDGHTFMVMAYIDGQDLGTRIQSGPVVVADALDTVIQVARAISKAHAQGIVHRDIKPGNVLITSEGQVKVVDFGLAKLATQTRLTRTGTTMGTVSYMSPEQARGDDVDHRTDIWSLGVMLYEMLAGRLPFRGEIEPAMLYSIMNEDPEPLTSLRKDVSPAVEDIIEKMLEKVPAKRYQTMGEVLSELETQRDQITLGITQRRFTALRRLKRRRRLASATVVLAVAVVATVFVQVLYNRSDAIDSIAVLPLENLSGKEDQEVLADELTVDLINSFSQVKSVAVINRLSMMRYKGTDKSPAEIARELNVKALVAGTVQFAGEKVSTRFEFIHAGTGRNLWSQSYESDRRGIQTLPNDVARAVIGEIGTKLTQQEEQRLATRRTVDPEAYAAFLRGRHFFNTQTPEKLRLSIDEFKRAIDIDPEFAQAYCGLGESWIHLAQFDPAVSWRRGCAEARVAVEKALEIDDGLAEAYINLGQVDMLCDADLVSAEARHLEGLRLNENSAAAQLRYAHFLVIVGRYPEALDHTLRAQRLDPLSPFIGANVVWEYFYSGRYDEALEAFHRTLELDPENPVTYWAGGWLFFGQGKYEEALPLLRRADELSGRSAETRSSVGYCLGRLGRQGEAHEILDDLIADLDSGAADPYHVAGVYAGLGMNEEAIDWIERSYREGDYPIVFLGMDTTLDGLRENPRFKELMKRLKIPDPPRRNAEAHRTRQSQEGQEVEP